MKSWLQNGHPTCYWLSGFFFPHGFMTGTLQTYARKHTEAIDLLKYEFSVQKEFDAEEVTHPPEVRPIFTLTNCVFYRMVF
jgi:dynein heavy chain